MKKDLRLQILIKKDLILHHGSLVFYLAFSVLLFTLGVMKSLSFVCKASGLMQRKEEIKSISISPWILVCPHGAPYTGHTKNVLFPPSKKVPGGE